MSQELQEDNPGSRDEKGRFLPGTCPNPSGRPKSSGLRAKLMQALESGDDGEIVSNLLTMAKNKRGKGLALGAIHEVWDRAEGKAVQSMNIQAGVDENTAKRLSDLVDKLVNTSSK